VWPAGGRPLDQFPVIAGNWYSAVMLSKTEIVWRHLLAAAIDDGRRRHASMSEIARELDMATSTVHDALRRPVEIDAVIVSGRALRVIHPWKLLMLWAARRDVARDMVAEIQTGLGPDEVEEILHSHHQVLSGFSGAVRRRGYNAISDYHTILSYGVPLELPEGDLTTVQFLTPDDRLETYGKVAPLAQCFADLFATPGWAAARFVEAMSGELIDSDVA
jgi:predicted DNA-binding protein YlxM (UPF0122 family)